MRVFGFELWEGKDACFLRPNVRAKKTVEADAG